MFAQKMSRRGFLKSGAAFGGALVVGAGAGGKIASASAAGILESDFVRVSSEGVVTVVVKHVEAGQGPATGLATLVAEEMNADWEKVEAVFAPADASRYANLFWGAQGTGGSTAIANSFMQYRKAGAFALARLRAAAAKKWKTAPENIRAENGVLLFGEKRAGFGEMAKDAGGIAEPQTPPELKKPGEFSYIGREGLPRKDLAGKTTGRAKYAMDYRPENLLHAVVLRSPKFGGVLKGFSSARAREVRGFAGAAAIPSGVAVYAETPWAAIKARREIQAEWDFSRAEKRSSEHILSDFQKTLTQPGNIARNDGDAEAALRGAAKTVAADYTFPFLAHAPMEPLNCVIQFRGGKATLWDGCQIPTFVQNSVAGVFGIAPENVSVVSLFAGGTFGRRATPSCDYQTEAAHALKQSPAPNRPLKLLWTREDDIRGGYYRPMFAHNVRAGISAEGNIAGWSHKIAGKSIIAGTAFAETMMKNGVDHTSVEGAANLPYSAADIFVDVRNTETAVPVLWWRSVGHTHTAFAVETMADMLAESAGADAVDFRLRHLRGHPRHSEVLRRAAEAANWGGKTKPGRFRGVAVHESFNSFVAQVAEISLDKNGAIKTEHVWCAVDCGIAVNPGIVRAQMESGIGYGLGAAMRNQIALKEGGEVLQTNFPDYEPLRMRDMPAVTTVIVNSGEPPTGAGEPGVPPIAPALANAIYAATGKRLTHLPLAANGAKFA